METQKFRCARCGFIGEYDAALRVGQQPPNCPTDSSPMEPVTETTKLVTELKK